jgi:hypothetical protein
MQSWIETYVNKNAKVTKKMIEERFSKQRQKSLDIIEYQIDTYNRLLLLKDK